MTAGYFELSNYNGHLKNISKISGKTKMVIIVINVIIPVSLQSIPVKKLFGQMNCKRKECDREANEMLDTYSVTTE